MKKEEINFSLYHFWKWGQRQKYCILGKHSPQVPDHLHHGLGGGGAPPVPPLTHVRPDLLADNGGNVEAHGLLANVHRVVYRKSQICGEIISSRRNFRQIS